MPTAEGLPPSIVLDTHVWVWASAGNKRMGFLDEFDGRCVVSAISVWEVGMLAAKGRLAVKPSVERWVERNLEPPVFLQPLTVAISLRSSALEEFHGDPADRIIAATALILRQPLLTADEKIADWFHQRPEWRELCYLV